MIELDNNACQEADMPSQTPALQPIIPAFHVQILNDAQRGRMKAATLEILEEVGVQCPSGRARQIYAEHGAQVDEGSRRVRLPPDVVLGALSQAPRFYTMGARILEFDLVLDGTATYCATDGCGTETIDFITHERRRSCKADVARMARVSDYLSSVGFYWPIVSAGDYPATAPLHEIEASFTNTVKHVQSETVMDKAMARYGLEMARVVAGNAENMRQRPPLSLLVCTIAPLALDDGGMEAALVFAGAGLPVGFMSMANAGSTGPATIPGTIVLADAEIVAALTLIQMAYPGAPVYHSLMPGLCHPRTADYVGSAWEAELFYPVGAELAHMWGVPTLAGVFGTDAPAPGWQSAADGATGLMLNALCGAETASGMGLLESCTLLYPEEILLDSDIYHRVRVVLSGLDINPAALALDVIKAVGPRGHFMLEQHTREHMRRWQMSELTHQPRPEGGYDDAVEMARQKVDWILDNHHPQPLDDAQQKELERILATADREMA
jgi:trimethylamine--corrinoid protein Co-methyltransferase